MNPRTAIAGAGIVGLITISGALAGPLAGIAGATDANVGVVSTCDAAGKWQLQFQVQSLYDQPLEVVLLDSHSPVDMTVPPNGQRQIHETPNADTFVYQWTSPVGHLHGDGVSSPVTLHRPGGCGPTTTTTVPGPTSTTTCAAAIPPRVDCGTTTVPATTVPPTVTTVAPPASSEVAASPSTSSAPTVPPGTPNRVARSTTVPAPPTALPPTGTQATVTALLGGILFGGGLALIIVAMRRPRK